MKTWDKRFKIALSDKHLISTVCVNQPQTSTSQAKHIRATEWKSSKANSDDECSAMSQRQELLGQAQLGFQALPCVRSAQDVAWPQAIHASASNCEGSKPHNVQLVASIHRPAKQDESKHINKHIISR